MERIITTTAKVKENNKEVIKNALIQIGQCTKNMVAKETGLSVATCNTLLNELARSGEILEVKIEKKANGAGRPSKTYRLNDQLCLICCLSLYTEGRRQFITYQIIDLMSNIISEKTIEEINIDYKKIHQLIESLLHEHSGIQSVSIGISGTIDSAQVIDTCDIPLLVGKNLIQDILTDFSLPVVIDNRMNLIAYGLYQQKAYTSSHSVIALSFDNDKCNDSGIIINGDIIHGKSNFAGTISCLSLQPEYTRRLLHPTVKVSHEEQIAKAMSLFIAVLNPDVIMLTGQSISITLIGPILDACKKIIPEEHMPELTFAQDTKSYYITGLAERALFCLNN